MNWDRYCSLKKRKSTCWSVIRTFFFHRFPLPIGAEVDPNVTFEHKSFRFRLNEEKTKTNVKNFIERTFTFVRLYRCCRIQNSNLKLRRSKKEKRRTSNVKTFFFVLLELNRRFAPWRWKIFNKKKKKSLRDQRPSFLRSWKTNQRQSEYTAEGDLIACSFVVPSRSLMKEKKNIVLHCIRSLCFQEQQQLTFQRLILVDVQSFLCRWVSNDIRVSFFICLFSSSFIFIWIN